MTFKKKCPHCGGDIVTYTSDDGFSTIIKCEDCKFIDTVSSSLVEEHVKSLPRYKPCLVYLDCKRMSALIKANEAFQATEGNIYRHPEDYNQDRTSWESIKDNADSLYYLLKQVLETLNPQ